MAPEPAIPIVVGVTGHRLIRPDFRDRLYARVEEILRSFCTRFESTPVIVFSSLAEGADQLCAEVAIKLNLRVIAPLPFPPSVYRGSTSFNTDESREKLTALLEHNLVEFFVVPLPPDMMPTVEAGWEKLRDDDMQRKACYANCGAYVALHCHALLALWDGVMTEHPAGTAEVVRFKLTGEPPEQYPWPQPLFKWADSGPVYVVHTPRALDGSPETSAGMRMVADCRDMYPGIHLANQGPVATGNACYQERVQQAAEKWQFTQTCRTIQAFNCEIRTLERMANTRAVPTEGSPIEKTTTQAHSEAVLIEQRLGHLSRIRAAAGQLAQKRHARIERLTIALFSLLFLALLCLHVYAHYPGFEHKHYPVLLSLFLSLLLLALVVVFWVWFGHLESRWMDFRSLAEALRVQLYWCRSGVNASVADNYLQQVRSDLTWVRRAVRSCSPPPHLCSEAFSSLTPKQQCEALDAVRKDWLQGQKNFFARHVRHHRKNAQLRLVAFGLAVLGWLLAVVMLMADARHPSPWLLISSEMLVVAGGLVIWYKEREFVEEMARQYERMHVLFSLSDAALQRHLSRCDITMAHRLLEEVGREALSENANWLITHRAHPLELPLH